MKRILSFVISICIVSGTGLLMPGSGVYGAVNAKPSMRIHAIYQGHPTAVEEGKIKNIAGDAVLIESDDEFLLMDTGSAHEESLSKTMSYLQKIVGTGDKQKPLSIYISHYHGDHTGGILEVSNKFRIRGYYLPDPSLYVKNINGITEGSSEVLQSLKKQYDKCMNRAKLEQSSNGKAAEKEKRGITDSAKIAAIDRKWRTEVVGVIAEKGIRIGGKGDVTLKILRETGTLKNTDGRVGFVNNNSLATMVTCGKIKYLTAGDLEKAGEWTVKKGTSSLKAHIFKLDHHGLRGVSEENGRSNYRWFLDEIQPKISFVQSKGDETPWERVEDGEGKPSGSKKYMRPYNSMVYARKYGLCFSTTHEEKNFIIDVVDNKIKLYRTGVPISNLREKYRMVGIRKIVLYRHGKNGEEFRKKYFYIDPKLGYRIESGLVKAKLQGKTYRFYVKKTGEVLVSDSIKIGKKTYYFDSKGRELTGKGGKVKVYS